MICSSVNLLFLMTPHSYSEESENSWLSFRVSRQQQWRRFREAAGQRNSARTLLPRVARSDVAPGGLTSSDSAALSSIGRCDHYWI